MLPLGQSLLGHRTLQEYEAGDMLCPGLVVYEPGLCEYLEDWLFHSVLLQQNTPAREFINNSNGFCINLDTGKSKFKVL